MMDTKALREKILDLAIRGKLVPQDPNDEPASLLLERIRAQKQQMVKDGKLKAKDIKDDTVIFKGEDNLHYEKFADGTVKCIEDEIPFDLPKGWEWERLSNIACFSGGKTPSTSDRACWGGNVLWVTSKDMKSKYIQSSMLKLSEKGLEQMQLYPANTLLLVTRSGILRHTLPVAILKKSATINQDIKAILPYISDLEEYIYICLKGMESRLILQYTKAGATVENINFDAFKRILLPIPPQKQIPLIISATIDAESIINILKINQENLIDTITKTKSKILGLAIRGKLVPQDPNDEPASVLLERIRAEKEELIRQGKIKRDKKDSVIFKGEDNSYYEKINDTTICIDKEIPFEIPETWSWTRFRNIVLNYDSQRRPITKHNRVNDFGLYDYYGATGVIDTVDSYIFDGEYLMIGEDGGNFFTQRDNSFIANGRFWANNHVHIVKPVLCSIWYLKYFLDNCDLAIMGLITGIGVPKLNQENMNKILIPIPPIEEQKKSRPLLKK
mgnify:CR=1 FL=1